MFANLFRIVGTPPDHAIRGWVVSSLIVGAALLTTLLPASLPSAVLVLLGLLARILIKAALAAFRSRTGRAFLPHALPRLLLRALLALFGLLGLLGLLGPLAGLLHLLVILRAVLLVVLIGHLTLHEPLELVRHWT